MKTKVLSLLSGGLDSTVMLHMALHQFPNAEHEAVSIDYGQRHSKEMVYAMRTARSLEIQHRVIPVGRIFGDVMLTDPTIPIPNVRYDEIKGVSPTFVPFRNGTFLSLLAARGQLWIGNEGADQRQVELYFGAHSEDAENWAYPDCTPEFIGAMGCAIYIGTYQKVRLHTPLMWLRKHEIVTKGSELGVDFKKTWSCYAGGEEHCGSCPTCHARKQAFADAGVPDPTVYAA